ncbi:MAG: hypothetical protein E7349_00470 [Clostridiales bacterium]|nr:hypothetical protein [Clostridiales bacterium]
MKKKTQKALLSALIVASAATLAAATVLSAKIAVAEVAGTTRFEMVEGASIRYSEPLGLRFIAELGEQEYADLTTPENGVTKKMGMYIMPWESISENDVITTTDYASIEKLDYVFYSSDGSVDEKIYEYEAENGETYYRANGVISNLKLHNYAKEFVGIGYIAETENGVTTYTYTDICKEGNVRSSAYIAIEAHADTKYAQSTNALSAFEKYIDGAQLYTTWGVTEKAGDNGVKTYQYNSKTYNSLTEVKAAITDYAYSLKLDRSVKYIKEKGTAQLNATIKDTTHDVVFNGAHAVYSSSNENVVKVDKTGKLTWVKNGTATITAEFAGAKMTCEVVSGVIDFNDGKLPSYIQNGGRASLSVVDGNGGKVLQATSENNDQGNVRIMMPLTHLGAFFEDESVEYLAFDLKLPEGATTPVSSIMYHSVDQTSWTSYETGDPSKSGSQFDTTPTDAFKSYYLPRSVYEAWVANGKTEARILNVQAGITQGASYWIDNIRAVTADDYTADLYSFETGSLRNMTTAIGYCQPNYNQFHFQITCVDASTAKFTGEIVSDGMRAIQFTKQAGESIIMFNGNSDPSMEVGMREAGYVSFDLYVPEGSDAKIKKNGQAWYGALKQGWNTIYEKVDATNNELIRFVDTTASTYVIDNFRLLTEAEYNEAMFGFEAGGVLRDNNANDATVAGWTYYYAGADKANNAASIQVTEGSSLAVLSNVRFATEQVHGGDYSLAFDKKSGWMDLKMVSNSTMYALLKDGFTFWIYSTTALNGTSSTQIVNGYEGKLNGGTGIDVEANTWTKITVMADDIKAASRFLTLTGGTAGTIYIDDFQPIKMSNITYDTGDLGTVAQATQSVVVGDAYTLATPTAYRDFLGWYNGDELVPTSGTWNIDGDVTLTARYADTLSFDDGVLPTYMTKAGSTESLSIVELDGNKVLQIKSTATTNNPIMNVPIEFLASFFEGTDVAHIAFDAKTGLSKIGNFRRSTMRSSGWGYEPYENDNGFNGIDTTYKTFFFTRADYDYWVANNKTVDAFIFAQGVNNGDSIYVDNIRPATQEEYELMMYSFGSGGVRQYSDRELFFYSPLTTVADRTFGMLLDEGKAFTNIGYVENGTDGNRAFQFTKVAGNVQLNFPSDKKGYTTIVTKTGYYAVDIYIPANSDATFTYHTTEWSGVTPMKGAWTTFYAKGNNVVQWTDTTGGTYLVDNIRSIPQEEYENALPEPEPVYNWHNAEVGETDENGVINGITFNASTHTNTSSTILPQPTDTEDMSYYHFGGDYGLDDFLVFDFTGNNMPILSFFNTEIGNTIYNHAENADVKGWIVANGVTNSDGTPHSGWSGAYANRINLIGPYKISYKFDDNGSGTATLSQVRAAVGSSSLVTMAKLNGSTDEYRMIVGWVEHATKTNAMSLRVVAWNLTTEELIVDFTEGEVPKADWTGDIALYGHFGRTTTVDKLYPVVEGLDNALALYTPTTVRYNTTWDGDDLILNASSYEGTIVAPTSADMSYIAFNGTYGMNDFVVFDFTGDNMPFVSFFNNQVTNTVFNAAVDTSVKGWVIVNGLRQNATTIWGSGTINEKRLLAVGPNKIKDVTSNDGNTRASFGTLEAPNILSIGQLQEVTDTYRAIIGWTTSERSDKQYIQIGVINMITGEVIYKTTQDFEVWTTEYTEGSIALHGQFGKETVLDKVIGVEENTTLDALLEKYATKDSDYSDEEAVTLDRYGYASLSNGQWQIDGVNKVENPTDWRDATNLNSDGKNQYQVYKEAGFNIVLAQDMINPDVDAATWEAEGKKYMDYAHEAGLKVILTDWHFQILSKPITIASGGVVQISHETYKPWIIATDASATTGLAKDYLDALAAAGLTADTTRFASRDALDNYVREQLAMYKDHSAFYGVMLADEPSYHNAYCYSEIYKSIKRVMPECYVQYNLLPMESDTVAIERYYTGVANESATSAQIEAAYKQYVELFLDAMGTDYIQYDDYPFKSATDGMWFWETTTPYIDTTSLRNIQLVAEIAKERGLSVKVVTQSSLMRKGGSDGDVLIRQITENDARWLNNYLMGFGVKQINYFTYWTKYANSTTGEYFEDGGSFVNRDGTTTAVYDFMKTIMANNTAFAPTISHFDYNASKVVGSNNGSQNNDHITWSSSLTADTSFRLLTSVTTNLEYTLVTELYDKENYNYMYMVMNTIDPNEGGTQSVTVTFADTIDTIYVYDQTGTRTAVTLTNNTYTVTLTAGQAVYLLPY